MSQPGDENEQAVLAEIQKARENQTRWLEMSPGLSAEPEEIAQWAKIESLRRHEVERLERILIRMRELSGPAVTEVKSKTASFGMER
jgi:hypothetical protein